MTLVEYSIRIIFTVSELKSYQWESNDQIIHFHPGVSQCHGAARQGGSQACEYTKYKQSEKILDLSQFVYLVLNKSCSKAWTSRDHFFLLLLSTDFHGISPSSVHYTYFWLLTIQDVTTPNISCLLIAKYYLCWHRIAFKYLKLPKISSFMFEKAMTMINMWNKMKIYVHYL